MANRFRVIDGCKVPSNRPPCIRILLFFSMILGICGNRFSMVLWPGSFQDTAAIPSRSHVLPEPVGAPAGCIGKDRCSHPCRRRDFFASSRVARNRFFLAWTARNSAINGTGSCVRPVFFKTVHLFPVVHCWLIGFRPALRHMLFRFLLSDCMSALRD